MFSYVVLHVRVFGPPCPTTGGLTASPGLGNAHACAGCASVLRSPAGDGLVIVSYTFSLEVIQNLLALRGQIRLALSIQGRDSKRLCIPNAL